MICEFCFREFEKASKLTNYKGLTLLLPDEKLICDSCLNYKSRSVAVIQAARAGISLK